MKRKLITGLLLCGCLLTTGSLFNSCKDSDEDLKNELLQGQGDLEKEIASLKDRIKNLEEAQGKCQEACRQEIIRILKSYGLSETTISGMQSDIDRIDKALSDLAKGMGDYVTKKDLEEALANLTKTIQDDIKNNPEKYGLVSLDKLTEELKNLANLYVSKEEYNKQVAEFKKLLEGLQEQINKLPNEDKVKEIVNQILDAKGYATQAALDELIKNFNSLKWVNDYKTLIEYLNTNKTAIENIINKFSTVEKTANDALTKATDAMNQANANKAKLETLDGLVKGLTESLNKLTTTVEQHDKDIKKLISDLGTLQGEVNTLKNNYTDLLGKHNALQEAFDNLFKEGGAIYNLQNDVKGLKESVATLTNNYNQLKEDLTALNDKVNKLMGLADRLNKLVTGIIIQATHNPVFGSLTLPVGIQSNVAMNYYGYNNMGDQTFPTQLSASEYNREAILTSGDMRMLEQSGMESISLQGGQLLMDNNDGNLGKIYLTINPSNVDFSNGMTAEFVNSRGETCKAEIRNIQKSEELLEFGYSRAEGQPANNFYEADVYLKPEDVQSMKFVLEDGWKQTIKDVIRGRQVNDFAALLRQLYKQFNGFLPAYGLRTVWDAPDGNGNTQTYSVVSNMNMAVTCARPLSFHTLYDTQVGSRRLPHISPLSEYLDSYLNPDRFKMDFNFKVNLDGIGVNLNFQFEKVNIQYDGSLKVHIKADVKDPATGKVIGTIDEWVDVDPENVNSFIKSIENAFNENIGSWNKEIQEKFDAAIKELMEKVNTAIQEALDDATKQINEQLADIIKSLNDRLKNGFDRIGAQRFINAYNRVADRVNAFLDDPNHYLQVLMIYEGGDGWHHLSTTQKVPSPFVKGSGNGITFLATTYNGEVFAPCYKKFVAITNVFDSEGKSAQADGGALLENLKAVNSDGSMCQVVNGNQRKIAVPADNLKSGYTYEVVYSAIDYHGYTSTRKYYFSVK